MIIFDLKCGQDHVFEAWFGSSQDFEDQRARGLVACPICGDTAIGKAVMAPAVGAKGNQSSGAAMANIADADRAAMLNALAEAQAKILENSEWVGRGFADRARAMHYGEESHASIHGEVAPAEAKALIDEGVKVAPLPLPVVPREAQN